MEIEFFWVDVFAATPLTGNPLALVPDADGIADDRMVALAREFNQSETTFLVAPTRSGADHRLRSFTPGGHEVLGAGHNALGAWLWLALSGRLGADREDHVQQIGDELLPLRVTRTTAGEVRVTMTQSPPRFLRVIDDTQGLAAALSLTPADLAGAPEVVSTGAEYLLVPVRDRAVVDRTEPDAAALRTALARAGAEGCYVYTTEPGPDGADAYARFFNPTVGIAEDPATGTAAGPLAARLVRDGIASPGAEQRILQGVAIGRPSTLSVVVEGDRVELSGTGLVVASGTVRL